MKKKFTLILLSAVLLTTGCGGSDKSNTGDNQSASNNEKITVVLDWTPNTNHTGMYVALEQGYYEEVGLDVEIQQPPEGGALALVASNKAQFAVDFQESLGPAIAAENPLPVVAVATLLEHNTSGLISLKETGINSPKDLEGKTYATWDTPMEKAIIGDIMKSSGGDINNVEMIPNTVTDVIAALQTDIDVVWIYYGWDGVATELAGLETNYLDFRKLNPVFDFYTPILVSGEKYLEENPEQAKKFLAATAKGYEYSIENPEEAASILVKHAPELDIELAKASQKYMSEQYKAEKEEWGTIDSSRWTTFYDWMYDNELLEKDLQSEGFTNEFLPQ